MSYTFNKGSKLATKMIKVNTYAFKHNEIGRCDQCPMFKEAYKDATTRTMCRLQNKNVSAASVDDNCPMRVVV